MVVSNVIKKDVQDGQGPRSKEQKHESIRKIRHKHVLLVFRFATAGWTAYAYFNPYGLKAIGDGMECLCHFATWEFQHILCISS